jgi:hypothetical protein
VLRNLDLHQNFVVLFFPAGFFLERFFRPKHFLISVYAFTLSCMAITVGFYTLLFHIPLFPRTIPPVIVIIIVIFRSVQNRSTYLHHFFILFFFFNSLILYYPFKPLPPVACRISNSNSDQHITTQ